MDRKRKTSVVSFRVEEQLKESLQGIAVKEGRTLSLVIERVLQNFLDFPQGNSALMQFKQDRRQHRRNEVILPARWRIIDGESIIEYDVLVKNIGVGGAYTQYINGQRFHLVKNLQTLPLALVVRMPASEESLVLDCKATRFQITKSAIGVGLRFIKVLKEQDILL
jgi:hypothetical protein